MTTACGAVRGEAVTRRLLASALFLQLFGKRYQLPQAHRQATAQTLQSVVRGVALTANESANLLDVHPRAVGNVFLRHAGFCHNQLDRLTQRGLAIAAWRDGPRAGHAVQTCAFPVEGVRTSM